MNRDLYNQLKEKLYDIYWCYIYSKRETLIEEYIEEHSDYFLEVMEQDLKNKILFKKAETMFININCIKNFSFKEAIKNALRSYIEKLYFEEFHTEANLAIKAFIKAVDEQKINFDLVEKPFKKIIKTLVERHIKKIQKEHEDGL
jgi:hypothetical protein